MKYHIFYVGNKRIWGRAYWIPTRKGKGVLCVCTQLIENSAQHAAKVNYVHSINKLCCKPQAVQSILYFTKCWNAL